MRSEEEPKLLQMPLSQAEVEQIRSGDDVIEVYHRGKWMAVVVAHMGEFKEEKYRRAIIEGHNVYNAPLTEQDLETIYDGAVSNLYPNGMKVLIMAQEVFDEVHRILNDKPNNIQGEK